MKSVISSDMLIFMLGVRGMSTLVDDSLAKTTKTYDCVHAPPSAKLATTRAVYTFPSTTIISTRTFHTP
ncbi:hypothetical protein M436DRAFT_86578 [Aureobasidium namibiae CBS 147.97]|uniref:Secreted protein n=1 Tax=Aureobasidium namibiae CBS 147.97 TaxID=1043004 RepID=A0A074W5W6_9PEZI